MAVPSGKDGFLRLGASDIANVRNIRVNKTSNNQVYADSSTSGHQLTVKGQFGGTLSFSATYDPAEPLHTRMVPGDQITLEVYQKTGHKWQYPCRINEIGEEINIETGAPPTVDCTANLHGAWTDPSNTASAG